MEYDIFLFSCFWCSSGVQASCLQHLKDFDSDEIVPSKAKHFAKNLRKSLQRRFPNFGLDEKVVGFGNFLDPHLKGIHLDQIGRLEEYVNAVTKAISGYEAPSGDTEEEIVKETEKLTPTEKLLRKKNNPLSEVFDIRSSGVKEAEKEIKVYRQLPFCPRSESFLTWWMSHADALLRMTIFDNWQFQHHHLLASNFSTLQPCLTQ